MGAFKGVGGMALSPGAPPAGVHELGEAPDPAGVEAAGVDLVQHRYLAEHLAARVRVRVWELRV